MRPTEKALELVEKAKDVMNRQFERLISRMGEEKFYTLVRLAQEASAILEEGTGDLPCE